MKQDSYFGEELQPPDRLVPCQTFAKWNGRYPHRTPCTSVPSATNPQSLTFERLNKKGVASVSCRLVAYCEPYDNLFDTRPCTAEYYRKHQFLGSGKYSRRNTNIDGISFTSRWLTVLDLRSDSILK